MSKLGVFLAAACVAGSAQAGVIDLGSIMGNANIYTIGNFKAYSSDVEGAIVAGGNVTMTDYHVSEKKPHAFGNYAIAAGGDVTLTRGTINGQVYAGGKASITSAVKVPQTTHNPVDFNAAANKFYSLASDLSALSSTGTVAAWESGVKVTGSGKGGVDIFNVSADLFRDSSQWNLQGLTAGQTLIFNVSGKNGTFRDGGITFNPLSGYNVLFNFYEAEKLNVKGVIGSVLAPYATVDATWGVINGNVVVENWNSTIQVNANHYFKPVDLDGFRDAPPSQVPEPGSLALLAAGLCAAAALRRRPRPATAAAAVTA